MGLLSALDGIGAETKANIAQSLWIWDEHGADLSEDRLAVLRDARNADAAFGERMRFRIQDLLDHPESMTPNYRKRYEALIRNCASLSPRQCYALSMLLGQDSVRGYEQMPKEANFRFPHHYAQQLGTQVGWYFLVGSCYGKDGAEYGIELMLFRYGLLPQSIARHFGLTDAENQVVELQLGVAKAGGRHYQAYPTIVAGTTGLLEFGSDALAMRLGNNVLRSTQAGSLYPMEATAHGVCRTEEGRAELGINLRIGSGRDVLRQGADGCSPCCGGVGTLYFSMPNLRLTEGSRLSYEGEEIELESGTLWFDHQWATGRMPGGSPRSAGVRAVSNLAAAGPGGWDWFIAQFQGNRQLTFASLHDNQHREFYQQTGSNPPGRMNVSIKGKYMAASGDVSEVTGTLTITEWVKITDSPDADSYWVTNTWHPNRWEYHLDDQVPDDMREFVMVPIVESGSAGFFAFGAQYAEGAVYLRDPQGREIGRGWAESVLYADPRRNMLALAGLPITPEMLDITASTGASPLLKALSLAYLAWPPTRAELKRVLADCRGV